MNWSYYINVSVTFECCSWFRTFTALSWCIFFSSPADTCNNTIKGSEQKKDSVKGRGSHPGLFCKKGVRKDFTKCTGKSLCRSLFLIKLHVFRLELYQKETPVQVFSLELCRIFQNKFFTEHLQTVASVRALDSRQPLNIFVERSIIDIQLSSECTSRFVDISMETFINGFSFFWIFSTFWALAAFSQVNCFSFDSCSMLKMFWIISDGNVQTSSYLGKS